MSKRKTRGETGHIPKKVRSEPSNWNEYNSFKPVEDDQAIEVVSLGDVSSQEFYMRYIKTRTPVVIDGVVPGLDLSLFQPEVIEDTLLVRENELLLVEKKKKGGFGSGSERIKMNFRELLDKLKSEGDNYYLTTQYAEDDPENDQLPNEGEEEEDEDEDEDDDEDNYSQEYEKISQTFRNETKEIAGSQSNFSDFSDADSIDFNQIHDDFDELEHELEESSIDIDDPVLADDLPGGPLRTSEVRSRIQEFVQRPLTKLIASGLLPLEPEVTKSLLPQQINLWIGATTSFNKENIQIKEDSSDLGLGRRIFGDGLSSGLHHDHADNLYVPVCGYKRFTIFSPGDAPKLSTVGNISKIYKSGVIDYKINENASTWRHVRSDGAIATEVAHWKLNSNQALSSEEKKNLEKLIRDENEELEDYADVSDRINNEKHDPPSFSRVPAAIVHLDKIQDPALRMQLTELAKKKWPEFFECKRITVHLEPGKMLYLPAGWFHEVTSFGDNTEEKKRLHIALNYWFSPPDGDHDRQYLDDYWDADFKRTATSCQFYKDGKVEL